MVALVFQSTRPRGARLLVLGQACDIIAVSIHAPTRGATMVGGDVFDGLLVSIHAPTRGATYQTYEDIWINSSFNPRAHAGRDLTLDMLEITQQRFQSTRPRGARHFRLGAVHGILEVSIHAPTRGATCKLASCVWLSKCFNPRAHAGRDLKYQRCVENVAWVSIHAPTRGATKLQSHRLGKPKFQSTRPRGARRKTTNRNTMKLLVSIHAPTRGATSLPPSSLWTMTMFQSTRPRGARLLVVVRVVVDVLFQSTRPRGARLVVLCVVDHVAAVSIHAPTRGATRTLPVI